MWCAPAQERAAPEPGEMAWPVAWLCRGLDRLLRRKGGGPASCSVEPVDGQKAAAPIGVEEQQQKNTPHRERFAPESGDRDYQRGVFPPAARLRGAKEEEGHSRQFATCACCDNRSHNHNRRPRRLRAPSSECSLASQDLVRGIAPPRASMSFDGHSPFASFDGHSPFAPSVSLADGDG